MSYFSNPDMIFAAGITAGAAGSVVCRVLHGVWRRVSAAEIDKAQALAAAVTAQKELPLLQEKLRQAEEARGRLEEQCLKALEENDRLVEQRETAADTDVVAGLRKKAVEDANEIRYHQSRIGVLMETIRDYRRELNEADAKIKTLEQPTRTKAPTPTFTPATFVPFNHANYNYKETF